MHKIQNFRNGTSLRAFSLCVSLTATAKTNFNLSPKNITYLFYTGFYCASRQ